MKWYIFRTKITLEVFLYGLYEYSSQTGESIYDEEICLIFVSVQPISLRTLVTCWGCIL